MLHKPLVLGALILLVVCCAAQVFAGDAFTGYQVDSKGQYFGFLGVRTPLMEERGHLQPFLQVFGAGLGYSFKENNQERKADLQSVTPSLGLKYTTGSWSWIGMAGAQFRWKQQEQLAGPKDKSRDVGSYVQLEAFRWQQEGIFHALFSYTDIDGFLFGRVRKTTLAHKSDQGCCSVFVGGDLAGMGNNQFYAVQAGPVIQLPLNQFSLTLKGGYQYTQTFQNGIYGGVEIYFPF